MDLGWLESLLKFLVAQVGPLGTVLMGVSALLYWLFDKEQKAHAATRAQTDMINEKRLELATNTLKALHGFQSTLEVLVVEVKRKNKYGRRQGAASSREDGEADRGVEEGS